MKSGKSGGGLGPMSHSGTGKTGYGHTAGNAKAPKQVAVAHGGMIENHKLQHSEYPALTTDGTSTGFQKSGNGGSKID